MTITTVAARVHRVGNGTVSRSRSKQGDQTLLPDKKHDKLDWVRFGTFLGNG